MKNSVGARAKFSRVEKQTNMQILFIFGLQCILCLIATAYGGFWRSKNAEKMKQYLDFSGSGGNSIFDHNWILNSI